MFTRHVVLPSVVLALIVSASSFGQDEAPPVVWEIQSVIGQSGWSGLSNPNATRFREVFTKPVVDSLGISSAVSTRGTWVVAEDWTGAHPTSALIEGDFGPASVRAVAQLSSNWSSQFILENAGAGTTVRAWVRGLPGTRYAVSTRHDGVWTGYLGDTGGMSLYGLGASVGRPCTNCSASQTFAQQNPFGNTFEFQTIGTPRQFKEYPGVWYSQALFAQDNGTPVPELFSSDSAGITHSAGESCILACGPRSQVTGGGVMLSEWNFAIVRPVRPDVGFDENPDDACFVSPDDLCTKIGRERAFGATTDFVSVPPATRSGTERIIDYRWYIDGKLLQAGADAATVRYTPTRVGLHTIRVVAIDDFGAWAEASGVFTAEACLADRNVDGQVDSADLVVFIAGFVESDPSADLSGDGQVDSVDLILFIGAFVNGCDPT